MHSIIKQAYQLQSTTPERLLPSTFLEPFKSLSKGNYPIINSEPKFIVNFKTKLLKEIRDEEDGFVIARYC